MDACTGFVPTRYPYTYSADYLRTVVDGSNFSRADAARLLSRVCETLGLDRANAACDFADAYIRTFQPSCIAQAIEARRAATGTGAVHESAVPRGCAHTQPESH